MPAQALWGCASAKPNELYQNRKRLVPLWSAATGCSGAKTSSAGSTMLGRGPKPRSEWLISDRVASEATLSEMFHSMWIHKFHQENEHHANIITSAFGGTLGLTLET